MYFQLREHGMGLLDDAIAKSQTFPATSVDRSRILPKARSGDAVSVPIEAARSILNVHTTKSNMGY